MMPIIGCTREDNCKRDAFLKRLAAERVAAGLRIAINDINGVDSRKYSFTHVPHGANLHTYSYYFALRAVGNPSNQGRQNPSENPNVVERVGAAPSDGGLIQNTCGNPEDNERHANGNRHLDGQTTTVEVPEERLEPPVNLASSLEQRGREKTRGSTRDEKERRVPETLVRSRQS